MASTTTILAQLRTVCKTLGVTINREPCIDQPGDEIELAAPKDSVFAVNGTHFLMYGELHDSNRERYVEALGDLDEGLDSCPAELACGICNQDPED